MEKFIFCAVCNGYNKKYEQSFVTELVKQICWLDH